MGTQQQFCLRWNNHQMNLLNVFDHLLQNESFVDVTLACDGFSLKAHKVVLSACSPYFQKLLLDNPCPHPIVILKDVNYADLKALVDFMYKGEVNVLQDQLQELLKTAELLKIKGLSEVSPTSSTLDANLNQKHNGSTVKENCADTVQLCATVTPVTSVKASSTPSGSPQSKRRRAKQRRKSGSASEVEDNILGIDVSPEVIESRVDVPQNSGSCDEASRPLRCNINNGLCAPKDEDSDDVSDPGIPEQSVHEGFSQDNDDIMNTPSLDPPPMLGMTPDYSSPSHQYNSSLPSGLPSDLSDTTLDDGNKNNMSRHGEYNDLATISTAITATQNMTTSAMTTSPEDCDPERKMGGHSNLGPQWTTNDTGHALESIRNGRVALTKASAMYTIPATPLWQRVKREGVDANKRDFTIASNWTEEDLHQALEAIRTGRLSITKAAVTFGIPNTTLWQRSRRDGIDTSRMSGNAHQSNYTEANLSQALDAIGMGRMSVNKASSTFGIPSSTLWSRAKRYGIETGRKRLWDQDRDEVMWQALQAVKAGVISMTQASIKFNVPYTTLWNHFKKWEMSMGLGLSHQTVPVSTASSSAPMSLNMNIPTPAPLATTHHHLPASNNTPMGISQHGGIPMHSQHHSVPHQHQHPHPIENIIPDNAGNNSLNS